MPTEAPASSRPASSPDGIVFTRQGRAAYLTLDNPQAGNAMSLEMMRSFRAALASAREDEAIELLVLTANGSSFCGGASLDWLRALPAGDIALWTEGIDEMLGLYADVHCFPKPILASVQGSVVGGGVGLLCLCDVVLASRAAKWHLPEMKLGMAPTVVLPALLHRIPAGAVRRLLFEEQAWSSESMLGFGVVSELAEPGELKAAVDRRVASALALPTEPRNAIKRLMLELEGGSFERQLVAVRPHALGTLDSAQAKQQIAALLTTREKIRGEVK